MMSLIDTYNDVLLQRVKSFVKKRAGTPVFTWDAHGWFNYALDNASKLGFTNITGYVFWQHSKRDP